MAKPRKPSGVDPNTIMMGWPKGLENSEEYSAGTNPNSADGHENANYQDTGISYNRSEEMSFKGDKTKQYSVGIQDLDEAVFYYFQNVIKPFVIQNGTRREVPVIYGAPERWKSFQRDGYYRDKKGAIMLPIIVIKRDTITKYSTWSTTLHSFESIYMVHGLNHMVQVIFMIIFLY